jgi:uncharacterized low-complexity protein
MKRLMVVLTAAVCLAVPAPAGATRPLDQQQKTVTGFASISGPEPFVEDACDAAKDAADEGSEEEGSGGEGLPGLRLAPPRRRTGRAQQTRLAGAAHGACADVPGDLV